MDDLKLLGRNDDLENEIKIVQTISKDINMNFGLEKCAIICLKRGRVQSKMHIGSTFENDMNPSASPSIRGRDLCFFTCYRSLYVVKLAGSNAAYLNAYLLHVWRSLKFPRMKLQPSI